MLHSLLLLASAGEGRLRKGEPLLSLGGRRRRSREYPRTSIRGYNSPPSRYLFESGNNQALLNCCGVDHKTSRGLLEIFEPPSNAHRPNRRTGGISKWSVGERGKRLGGPRGLGATGALALVLFWYRTKGSSTRTASLALGLTSSALYEWLRPPRRTLLHGLQHHPDARVRDT